MFVAGMYCGYNYKTCSPIVREVTTHDTTIVYEPIGSGTPLTVITKPSNRTVYDTIIKRKVVSDTMHIYDTTRITFTSTDTLRFKGYDSLYVAIKDAGNSEGVISRQSELGGSMPTKITTTTTVRYVDAVRPPRFSLYGGAMVQWPSGTISQAVDNTKASVIIGATIKGEYEAGYTYTPSGNVHGVFLTKKIFSVK